MNNQQPNFNLDYIRTCSPNDAKAYIDRYFIPLTDGRHAVYSNGTYSLLDQYVVKNTYFKRMSKELETYYFKHKTDVRELTYELGMPRIYDNKLNLCPPLKHTVRPYATFDNATKDKVQIMLRHIYEVICSCDAPQFEFIQRWLANVVKGTRNDSCLYLRGPQGAGKSTLFEFLREHVIGNALCYQGGSGPIKTRFNSELSGKLLVIFEELENFSTGEWFAISSVLKRNITSPTLNIESKCKDSREEKNLNNYVINTNNDSLKDEEGRRYNVLDILPKYIGNREYFQRVYTCFNDHVGHAFFCYLLEVNTEAFNSQVFPASKAKLDAYSKRLECVYRFLRDEYILKNRGIDKVSVKDLHNSYVIYIANEGNGLKPHSKIDFNNSLRNININYFKSNKGNYYKVTLEFLQQIADRFHWIHDLDEFDDTDSLDKDIVDV